MDKHGLTIYTTYISVDLAHHEIFRATVITRYILRAKVGKGGINTCNNVAFHVCLNCFPRYMFMVFRMKNISNMVKFLGL